MAIRTVVKDGKTFYEAYVNGFDSRGLRVQRKRKWIESRRKAETIEFELKRELAILKEQRVSYRWHEWFRICMDQMKHVCKPSTIFNYEGTVKKWAHPHWRDLEIASITKTHVYEVVFEKSHGLVTPNARKHLLKMVKRIFQMAVDEGALDRNPCAGMSVKIPDLEQKVFTNAEVEIFLREAKSVNHRFYNIWVVALMTGMRSGEMFALRWTDIDFETKLISISRQWTSKNGFGPTKTRLNRMVPISDDLLRFLKGIKLQQGGDSEFVLPRLREWEQGEQARVTRDFCEAIGITQVKFHDLRATFITNLLSRGESLARVMAMVGHNELKTTNGYLRRAGVEVQGGTEKLGYGLPREISGQVLSIVKRLE